MLTMLTMRIIITTMSLASATRHACDEDAARALKRPWAPVVFHGERETRESLSEIDKRFTKDGYADEAAGFRAVDASNEMEPIPALAKAYVPGSPHLGRQTALAGRGLRRGRRPPRPLLAAPRGALPVDVGTHGRAAPVRRRPLHRKRRDGRRAVAREDPGGGERGLPLVRFSAHTASPSPLELLSLISTINLCLSILVLGVQLLLLLLGIFGIILALGRGGGLRRRRGGGLRLRRRGRRLRREGPPRGERRPDAVDRG